MLRLISDRRESPLAEIIEKISQLRLQRRLSRILANFPLPEEQASRKRLKNQESN